MTFTLRLDNRAKKSAAIGVLFTSCTALGIIVISHFVINTLSDDGVVVLRSTLASAAAYFPQSARLQARLAQVELAETMGEETDLARAEAAAVSAVKLAPWNSNNHLLLASVRNVQGDLDASESALRSAVALAPHSAQVHWQLANLLVRQDKVDEAIEEFQAAVEFDSSTRLLPGALDVVWNISVGNLDKLALVVGSEANKRLLLAQYLLKQERPVEAVTIYKSIKRETLLAAPAATEFLNSLIAAGQIELAKDLWDHFVATDKTAAEVLYNGSFEQELVPALSQFDWKVTHSEYATMNLDSAVAHTGKRSLRLKLTGRDTTVLGKELRQLIPVNPGVRYRLEFYAKTENLITTEGVHLAIADPTSLVSLATSNPIATGSTDWQLHTLDFVASAKSKIVIVTIKRTPRFSYDEPSRGTVWLDDVTLRAIGQGK